MTRIAVADLGTGNLRSVARAVEHTAAAGTRVDVTRDADSICRASRVVLPGQGAIGSWLAALEEEPLRLALIKALENKPVLAICVGMQALYEFDHEDGGRQCLGILKGEVVRFAENRRDEQGLPMKVPQMGWNQVHFTRSHPLWAGIDDGSWFYFVHSYYASGTDSEQVVGETEFGLRYCSAAARNNIFAIQCHPEKSQAAGLKLFSNFLEWSI